MTESLDKAFANLDSDGFCVVPDVLGKHQVDQLNGVLDALAAQERTTGTSWYSHGNQRVFNLANKGQIFLDLIAHPLALELARHMLGPDCLLSSITANIANPGNTPQHLHADQGYIPQPWPRAEAVNLIWVLDPFTAQNGATRIIPGSHRWASPPAPKSRTVALEAPLGALVCMDGRVWHGTGRNETDGTPRRGLFAYYCRPYVRQQENFSRSLRRDLLDRLSPTQRALLGFDIWEGLGSVNGLPVDWMDGRQRIGPTNEDGLFTSPIEDLTE